MSRRRKSTPPPRLDPRECAIVDDPVILATLDSMQAPKELVPSRGPPVYYVRRSDLAAAQVFKTFDRPAETS